MVGYNKNCKICNSEHRVKAELMKEEGASLQRIVDHFENHGETLSRQAVKRHFDTHFSPKEEAAKQYYEKSEEIMKKAVGNRLDDLEMLDSIIEHNYRMFILAKDHVVEDLTTEVPLFHKDGSPMIDPASGKQLTRKFAPSKSIVDLVSNTNSGFVQAKKLKAELLGDKEEDGKVIKVLLPKGFELDDDDTS